MRTDDGATVSINVKATPRQKRALERIGAPYSEFGREAIEEKLTRDVPGYPKDFGGEFATEEEDTE